VLGRPEGGGLSRLDHPTYSIERETAAPNFERSAGLGVLALYSPFWGLTVGPKASALGFLNFTFGYQRLPGGQSAMMTALGFLAFSLDGFDLSLWGVFANLPYKKESAMQSFAVTLGIPLYARWLPLRIPNTRIVLIWDVVDVPTEDTDDPSVRTLKPASYKDRFGIGLEWGLL